MTRLFKRYDVLLTIALFALMVPAERYEMFSALEDQTITARQLFRHSDHFRANDNIVFVNTDEAFFAEYKSWPLKRSDIGRIVENIASLGARVVAVDLLLDFPSSYGDDGEAAAMFERAGNALLVSRGIIEPGSGLAPGRIVDISYPIDAFRNVAVTGYTNLESSSRVIEMMSRLRIYDAPDHLEDGWPFSVQALSMYLGAKPSIDGGILRIGDAIEIPLDDFNDLFINYPSVRAGETSPFDDYRISATEFLDLGKHDAETLEELRAWVDGKLVLVGDTSEVSHDYFETPIGSIYGVELIAATIDTLQSNAPLRPVPHWGELLVSALLLLLLLATARIVNPTPRVALALAGTTVWLVAAIWLYAQQGWVLSMSYAMVAGALSFLIINLRFYLQERGQKTLIRDAFGQYLSPKVVNILVKDPTRLSLGGERRHMTAYFSDVAGFSTISEQLTPEELVALLNDYLTQMCDIIADYDGTVDKFEGDAIIAFWGAPLDQKDHARLACFASIDMQKQLVTYRERLAREGRPILNVRMGLNSGDMLVGNLGSRQRMDYTIMGDAVNLAARLEGANKFYGTSTMISGMTYELVKDDVEVRELDTIRVVGKREPVTVYELLDRKGELSAELTDLRNRYDAAMALYKARRFGDASAAFEAILQVNPNDGPSKTYVKRCQHYVDNPPPADWDGVFQLTEKG